MPANDGKLTDEEKLKLKNWVDRQWKGLKECPICRSPQWVIADHLVSPTIFSGGGNLVIGGTAYPLAMIISTPCGHTVFLNAVMAGLVPGGTEPPTEPKKD